jgi:tetratricopeptide (TPR) repeat protein
LEVQLMSFRSFFVWLVLGTTVGLAAEPDGGFQVAMTDYDARLRAATNFEDKVDLASRYAAALMLSGHGSEARAMLDPLIREKADAALVILEARSHLSFPPTDAAAAMKILKVLLKKEPTNVDGLLEWARALRENHNYVDAIKTYDAWILKRNPREFRALYGKIDTLILQKRFPEALQVAQDTLDLDRARAESHYYVGKVAERWMELKDGPQKAAACYRRATELASDSRYHPPLFFAHSMYNIPGLPATVAELKQKAPEDAAVAFADGLALEQRQKNGEALAKYEGAIAANYNLTWAHFAAGMILSGQSCCEILGRPNLGGNRASIPVLLDTNRAMNEFAIVRFQDPSFPLISLIDEAVNRLQVRDVPLLLLAPQQEEQLQKWDKYLLVMQRHQ